MPKTPKQSRQATARTLERKLPVKPAKGGETVIPDALARKIIRELRK